MSEWPKVVPNDDGIRPAGQPDQCFYCHRYIGQEHARDCVVITKRVKVKYIIELELDVPFNWTGEDVESHRNESSWCAMNATNDIERFMAEANTCLCSHFHCQYVGIADNTPKREIRGPDVHPLRN